MVGHAHEITRHLTDAELKRTIEAQRSAPLPALGFVYAAAAELDIAMETSNGIRHERGMSPIQQLKWGEANHKHPKTNNLFFYPVQCTFMNFNEYGIGLHGDEKTDTILKLMELGVHVFGYSHVYRMTMRSPDGPNHDYTVTLKDDCLALPIMRLSGTAEEPVYDRDVEGRGLFYAWMINRGYATEHDIENAFNVGYLKEAQKPQIKRAIEDVFGPTQTVKQRII